jgi:hypothetical protein
LLNSTSAAEGGHGGVDHRLCLPAVGDVDLDGNRAAADLGGRVVLRAAAVRWTA